MKTSRTAPKPPLSRRTLDIRKALDIRRTLPLLDNHNGTHGVNEAREDEANGPILDAEEVTISPSMNAKG